MDLIVNCTGPDYRVRSSSEPLMRSLLKQRLVSADALELGLRTDVRGRLIGADGHPEPHLFYLGPLLRATHWEATAVPELRAHAERLAGLLSQPDDADASRHLRRSWTVGMSG